MTFKATAAPVYSISHAHLGKEIDDMGRRRLQQKGDLRKIGGWWRLRWHEDQIQADGRLKYGWSRFHDVGKAVGTGRLTRPQAEREAWERYLSCLDQHMRTPQSVMTVAEFVERRFIPEHVVAKKLGGRTHYTCELKCVLDGVPESRFNRKGVKMVRDDHGKLRWPDANMHRLFGIGGKRMRDIGHEDVQRLVSEAIQRGYSTQRARHIKTCVSAIFSFAEEVRWFNGRNPAKFVRLPEMTTKPVRVLSFAELTALLESLKPMARAMVLCASLTSMNIAEVCGLRWKRVNLSGEPVIMDGESLPAHHAAIREQWYLRQWGTVKEAARRRNLPLPSLLVSALTELRAAQRPKSLDNPVFAGESGRPIDSAAMLNRQLRPAAKLIGAPQLGWHWLRRTFATLADQIGMSPGEIQNLMGHARFSMSMRYTHTPTDQAILGLEKMAERIKQGTERIQ